jgi:hypothetical protein
MTIITAYHGTNHDFDELELDKTVDGGVHFGTLAQAAMRAAGKGKRILEAEVDIGESVRYRDTGSGWKAKIASAKSNGFDSIVYLNRHEGVSVESVLDAERKGIDLDVLTDASFRRAVPEATDSWIVFDQKRILNVRLFEGAPVAAPRKAKKPAQLAVILISFFVSLNH